MKGGSPLFLRVTPNDLIVGYIGGTSIKTRNHLEKMYEGVLLIDEAYQLTGCQDIDGPVYSQDLCQESIAEIVNHVDKNIGLSVIIAPAREDKITNCFLAINKGMHRYFPHNMRLLLYSAKDLFEILLRFITGKFGVDVFTQSQSKLYL